MFGDVNIILFGPPVEVNEALSESSLGEKVLTHQMALIARVDKDDDGHGSSDDAGDQMATEAIGTFSFH